MSAEVNVAENSPHTRTATATIGLVEIALSSCFDSEPQTACLEYEHTNKDAASTEHQQAAERIDQLQPLVVSGSRTQLEVGAGVERHQADPVAAVERGPGQRRRGVDGPVERPVAGHRAAHGGPEEELRLIETARERWRQGMPCAVAVVGELGSGKTSLINSAVKETLRDFPVYKRQFVRSVESEKLLAKELSSLLRLPSALTLDQLEWRINEMAERGVISCMSVSRMSEAIRRPKDRTVQPRDGRPVERSRLGFRPTLWVCTLVFAISRYHCDRTTAQQHREE